MTEKQIEAICPSCKLQNIIFDHEVLPLQCNYCGAQLKHKEAEKPISPFEEANTSLNKELEKKSLEVLVYKTMYEEERGRIKELEEKLKEAEKYENCLRVVQQHHEEENRLRDQSLNSLKKDLEEYFKNNNVEGCKIKQFELRHDKFDFIELIPIEPPMEESYEGGNDEDIKAIYNRHGFKGGFVYWMYHK